MDDIVLEVREFKKRFGAIKAVDGLDLEVRRGDIFGFLGPNGAGKSTTIRAMAGLVRPSNGEIRIFGHDVWRDRKKALSRVGMLVESPGLYRYLTGRQNLEMFAELSGGKHADDIKRALEITGLTDRADDKVKNYSHGMKQRLGLAQAILCQPELVILDEPTDGLDPQGMKEVRELIKNLAGECGITVFLSSHLLHEVEQVCTKVAVIHKGQKLADGKVSDILTKRSRIKITIDRTKDALTAIKEKGLSADISDDGCISVQIEPNSDAAEINSFLVEKGFRVSAVIPEKTSLEEFYFSIMGEYSGKADKA